jgi:hypothetical protein
MLYRATALLEIARHLTYVPSVMGITRELALEGRLGATHHSLSNEIHTAT